MPAQYRVRLRGRTFTVWDHNERSAVATAHEWLDASEKLGIDPDVTFTVERIGDSPGPDDLLGTMTGTEFESHAAVVPREPLRDRVLYSIVGFCRRLFRRSGGSAIDDRG